VLRGLLEADFCDAVLAVVGSSAQFQPALAVEPITQVAGERSWAKPLASFLAPQADASLSLLAERGIAAFRTPEACADALAACLLRRKPTPVHDSLLDIPLPLPVDTPRVVLDEPTSLDLFDRIGVPTVRREVCRDEPWRHGLEGPVAVKLVSADLPHKTEAGAVALGLEGADATTSAIREMLVSARRYRPEAVITGVLIQSMVRGTVAEVLIGYCDDPALGPFITAGSGGRLAEVFQDSVTRVAPVSLDDAFDMIDAVRGLAPVRGVRGQPGGDVDGLARAIVALSQLASHADRRVAEAEINPLLVMRDAVLAVDGLVVLKSAM
jgi:acyl-CoA synthetase (NDP forming)